MQVWVEDWEESYWHSPGIYDWFVPHLWIVVTVKHMDSNDSVCIFTFVVSCRALNVLSGSSLVSIATWSLFSVSPKSTRIIVERALSPAHCASAMSCWGKNLCIQFYVEASHHPKRETTAGQVTIQWNTSLLGRGLTPTPSATFWEPRKEPPRTTTLVQQSTKLFPGRLIPVHGKLKAQVARRTLPLQIQHLATVSITMSWPLRAILADIVSEITHCLVHGPFFRVGASFGERYSYLGVKWSHKAV